MHYNCNHSGVMWPELQSGRAVVCLSRGHKEDIDRSHRASEPHVSLLTFASHTWCWVRLCVSTYLFMPYLAHRCVKQRQVLASLFVTLAVAWYEAEKGCTHYSCLTAGTRLEVCEFMSVRVTVYMQQVLLHDSVPFRVFTLKPSCPCFTNVWRSACAYLSVIVFL